MLSNTLDRVAAQAESLDVVLLALGRTDRETDDLIGWSKLEFPAGYSNFGFGAWLNRSSSPYREQILDSRSSRHFTVSEMNALYGALREPSVFGATKDALRNDSVTTNCDVRIESARNETYRILSQNSGCGLMQCLNQFRLSQPEQRSTMNLVSGLVERYLCTNQSFSCFVLPNDTATRFAYVRAFADYVFDHLITFVFHHTVILPRSDILSTKPQHVWATGCGYDFTLSSNCSRQSDSIPRTTHSSVLRHFSRAEDARERGTPVSLYTCYDAPNAETNFRYKGKKKCECVKIESLENL